LALLISSSNFGAVIAAVAPPSGERSAPALPEEPESATVTATSELDTGEDSGSSCSSAVHAARAVDDAMMGWRQRVQSEQLARPWEGFRRRDGLDFVSADILAC
jgi:hypothetical protein